MSALEVTASMPGPLWWALFCLAGLVLVTVLVQVIVQLSRPATPWWQWVALLGTALVACAWLAMLVLAALTSSQEQGLPGIGSLGAAW